MKSRRSLIFLILKRKLKKELKKKHLQTLENINMKKNKETIEYFAIIVMLKTTTYKRNCFHIKQDKKDYWKLNDEAECVSSNTLVTHPESDFHTSSLKALYWHGGQIIETLPWVDFAQSGLFKLKYTKRLSTLRIYQTLQTLPTTLRIQTKLFKGPFQSFEPT